MFVPNRERVETICKELTQSTPAEKRLLAIEPILCELSDQDFRLGDPDFVTVESAVAATKLALKALKDASTEIPKSAEDAIDRVFTSGVPMSVLLGQIEGCATQLRAVRGNIVPSQNWRLIDIVLMLLKYVSKPLFKLQCYWKEQSVNKPDAK